MKNIKEYEKIVYQAVLDKELEIDSQGRIWRISKRGWDRWNKRVRVNSCTKTRAEHRVPQGYLQIRVMYGKKRYHTSAHRVVFMHFNGEIPKGMTINHKNGIKDDNRPENLELMTHSEQTIHARRVLKRGRLDQSGEKNSMSKLTKRDVKEIRIRRSNGEALKSIAKDYGVAYQTISKIARGDRWS